MSEQIEITARVLAFEGGAMFDHYEDGSWASFDATSLEVLTPADEAGRELVFFHDSELPADSPWRQIGRRVRFHLRSDRLSGGRQLFTAAARQLRLLDGEPEPEGRD